ncbi:tyrosine-type recombinase/integrase [Halobaculum halobium]|uniref:tyrosine-type recombinase/integrase n=1 Tax=Halobaculum halobium TaxID=3032281 RepID=UPI003620ED14
MAWTREPLTESELDKLLAAADERNLDHQVAIYTLAHTGMRADELAHLRDGWIDWQSERLRVPPPKASGRRRLSTPRGRSR